MTFENFYKVVICIALAVIIFMGWKISSVQKDANKQADDLKKSILALDKLQKEKDGQYSKLVNYFNTERDLLNQLEDQNKDLKNTIKKQDERLLSISNAVITLDAKVVSGFGQIDKKDTNKVNFSLKYPDEKDPFIFWDGWVNRRTAAYGGKFTFGSLPISIVLTEESRGLWKSRLIGPSWLKVDSMTINSIPPVEYAIEKPKKLQWLVGGSYHMGLNSAPNAVGINFGVNLFDIHSLTVGATTLQQVSFGYLFKIKSFKRKN
ncbi:hypothetical protein UFOVP699_84 [uncultured Caudovirales phage]|uniref:Uncharacterized protein n=1 Tax=uncultured Caudovirales phage TaxID=2100421 RepID=A0A6J5NHR3_9CAUD|nr:hypothetical protein UFOVP699_84 [uncultured Caudovirales phage]